MEAVAEDVAETFVSDVLQEALDEVKGRSNRKWGVALVSLLLLGLVIAVVVAKRQGQQSPAPYEHQVSPQSPPVATTAAT